MERDKYIRRCISEHLGNEKNYKVLTTQQVETRMRGLKYQLQKFLDKFWSDPDSKHLDQHWVVTTMKTRLPTSPMPNSW